MTRFSVLSKREKVLLVLVGVAALIGVPMLLIPQAPAGPHTLPAAQARLKFNQAVRQRMAMEDDIARVTPELAAMSFEQPAEQVVPLAVRTILQNAADSGIHLSEIKPLHSRKVQSLLRIPISLHFLAGFGSIAPFLYRLESPDGRLVVSQYSISRPDPKSAQVDVTMEVQVFTRNPSEGPAKTRT